MVPEYLNGIQLQITDPIKSNETLRTWANYKYVFQQRKTVQKKKTVFDEFSPKFKSTNIQNQMVRENIILYFMQINLMCKGHLIVECLW